MLTVNMEKRGDYYVSLHQDARDIADALNDVVVTKSGGAEMVGFPSHALEEIVVALNNQGISVKINGNLKAYYEAQ